MSDLVKYVQQISVNAMEASKPCAVLYGTVTSASPLKIFIEQKMEVDESVLVLTDAVRDYSVAMTVNHETEDTILNANHDHEATNQVDASASEGTVSVSVDTTIQEKQIDLTHKHKYVGKKIYRVHNALKVGEAVLLLRFSGGQQFLVLSRVNARSEGDL